MSSEAQIKKRRDNKKKRKDDVLVEEKENVNQEQAQSHTVPKTSINGDLNIHLHKEASTGGGLCAKVVFFVLLTILTALVALLVNEHRETTEFEVIDAPRYAKHARKSIDELAASVEESEEHASEEDELGNEEEDNTEIKSDEIASAEEDENHAEELSEENKEDAEDEDDENDAHGETEELSEEATENQEDDEEQEDLDDDIQSEIEPELPNDSKIHENSDDDKSDEVIPTVEAAPKDESGTDDITEDKINYHMVIKFGVGTSLVVVAYIVLVQKWRTESSDKVLETRSFLTENESECSSPNLSRRNTIVVPPSLKDVQCDIENIDEEYPHDTDESDSDDGCRSKPTLAQKRYQELQSSYSNTLTPDWEPQHLREKLMQNYEVDDESDVEEEAEDEEDIVDQDDDFDDEISEGENEELLKRLERKYGKLQQNDNNDEVEMPNDEDDDDEDFQSWKRVTINQDESESENDQDSDGPQAVYQFSDITNSDDWIIRDKLDHANSTLESE